MPEEWWENHGIYGVIKHLDNLCKDMNGIGITGYIKDMEQEQNGDFYITGWKNESFSHNSLCPILRKTSSDEKVFRNLYYAPVNCGCFCRINSLAVSVVLAVPIYPAIKLWK